MNLNKTEFTDECYTTALQMFVCCGVESTSTLHVDALIEKFAPSVQKNKSQYSYLRLLLDLEGTNPEITVAMLAEALHKCSGSKRLKVEMDERFNLENNRQGTLDSDSGVSTDGFQLEELQCELQEKKHAIQQLRSQLEFTERQHDETLAALTSECKTLKIHIGMLRDENNTLSHIRGDYEELYERLCANEGALDRASQDVESFRKKNKTLEEQISELEIEKESLQEHLSSSAAECHRINEMYAGRQAALLEHNEALRAECAERGARHAELERALHQVTAENSIMEKELKDLLNKSNQIPQLMDRSIDVSCTEEQMRHALDSLNADSRFSQENQILDEESFLRTLKEDQGRPTNQSLFDEIMTRFNISSGRNSLLNDSDLFPSIQLDVGTQTEVYNNDNKTKSYVIVATQTDFEHNYQMDISQNIKTSCAIQTENIEVKLLKVNCAQTEDIDLNNNLPKCHQCDKYIAKLNNVYRSVNDMQIELNNYEVKLNYLEKDDNIGKDRHIVLQGIIKDLEMNLERLNSVYYKETQRLNRTVDEMQIELNKYELKCNDIQKDDNIGRYRNSLLQESTVATQTDIPCHCSEFEKRNAVSRRRSLRRFFWTPLKCLFQVFAVLCFIFAILVLYGVTTRVRPTCSREAVPWRWMDAQDIMDFLLRIDYVADLPM